MEDLDTILQDRLAVIYNDFTQNLDGKIAEIRSLWKKARSGRSSSDRLERLMHQAQELESSSAPFNLFTIADVAHKLGMFLGYILGDRVPLTGRHKQQIDLLISLLESAASNLNRSSQDKKPRRWEPEKTTPEIESNRTLVYIIDSSHLWAEQITNRLETCYRVQTFYSHESLVQALSVNLPNLIITDTKLDTGLTMDINLPGMSAPIDLSRIPVIFIAHDKNINTRLLAVRSNARGFFTFPLFAEAVFEKVRELTTGVPREPFRVMIVDNDVPMAKLYSLILGQEGMNVTVAGNPEIILEQIEVTRPELILLNLTMPEFSGIELTRIIRQEENYAGVSIVYLSDETSQEDQLAAINSGGDDFISLPIDPEYLVATVSSRLYRARTLNTINNNLLKALREVENQQFALDQHAIVSITNISGTIIYVNKKLCDISGYTRSELIGKDHSILKSDFHDNDFFKEMWSAISQGTVWRGEICNRKKNGELYWVDTTIVPFIDKQMRPYQFVSINSDITAKKFTELDLLEARDMAVNASQAKSEFLSKMSHELRTPLNAVLGFSQLLETSRDHPLSDNQLQFINEIHNAGEHLLNLINEVLDLSRIEANQLFTESVNISLPSFLDECVALVLPAVKSKNIVISTPYRQAGDVVAYADPVRLKQVMINLLTNAVKYNKPAGKIIIDISQQTDHAIFINVTDFGEGIDIDQIEKLFQPFTRLPQHRKIEGAGIGLALCKRLVELMGGRIGVNSCAGDHTTFWIEIKKASYGQDPGLDDLNTADTDSELPAKTSPATLLYIEDNETNLLLIREIIADQANLELRHASTVESGMELARLCHPDIILMDLELPDMNGFEGVTMLKQDQSLKSVPVIAISAYADHDNIQRALKSGFEEYITKPINIKIFLATIEKYR